MIYDLHEAIIAESKDAITVEYKEDYILTIESWGQMNTKDLFEQAIVQLIKIRESINNAFPMVDTRIDWRCSQNNLLRRAQPRQ